MSNEPLPTDYTPPEVFRKRAGWGPNMARPLRERFFPEPHQIDIAFDTNFDRFAANAAHALRHRLFYRTDGGRFARGLVRESGDLQRIHEHYKDKDKGNLPSGTKVRLQANIVRRKYPTATEQWEVTVRFFMPVAKVDEDEAFVMTPNPRVLVAEELKVYRMVVGIAATAAQEINKINRNRGERIIKIVAIAEANFYSGPKFLWHYNPEAVRQYIDLNTSDRHRRDMTAANGGRLPFEGHSASQSGPWRIYPFVEMVRECAGKPVDVCKPIVYNRLLHADDQLFAITDHVKKVDGKGAIGGGSKWGPLVDKFLRHLKGMQDSPYNFLSAYKQK